MREPFKNISLSYKCIQVILGSVLGVSTRIGNVSRVNLKNTNPNLAPYNRLYLNNTELEKLLNLIMPLLETKDMVVKFAIRYKNDNDQQRWISIMKKAMPKFHDEIDRIYGL